MLSTCPGEENVKKLLKSWKAEAEFVLNVIRTENCHPTFIAFPLQVRFMAMKNRSLKIITENLLFIISGIRNGFQKFLSQVDFQEGFWALEMRKLHTE